MRESINNKEETYFLHKLVFVAIFTAIGMIIVRPLLSFLILHN